VSSAGLLLAAALGVSGRVVVFPPAGPDRGAPGWIGAAVEETLPRALQRGGIRAVPAADRRRALEAFGVTGPVATRATGVRLAEAFAARVILFGSWDLAAGELSLSLEPFDAEAAERLPPVLAKGPVEDLGRLVAELARELAGRGPAPPGVPFAALRALGEGLVARDPQSRLQGARRALELQPGYPEAALALARLLFDHGRHAEAREVLAGAGQDPAFERERLFLDGACLLGLGRHAEADVLYAGLAASEPSAPVLANRAIARLRRPDATGASTLLRQALELAPLASELPFGLGFTYFVEGDAEAAVFWLRDAVRYAPGDALARLALSWALRGTARADEADEQWQAATALDPTLESQRQPDRTRRLERILPSETALLLDPERKADARRLLRER
jgi:tetratricopeptide (TPR) repeat protein